ncbi:MAG: methyl-accepting chemotaxis protein [Thermodesulfobacteriota bacterium]|nr:methyl-accepting chemotaxis protein [Thermodesulfobacteriota bacterium]
MKISTKIGLLTVSTVLLVSVLLMVVNTLSLQRNNDNHLQNLRALLSNERKAQIHDLLSNAYSLVSNARFYTDATFAFKDMRFGVDHQNSFLVFDHDYYCHVYPARQELEGSILRDIKDADGNYIYQQVLKTAREKGEGYLEYRVTEKGGGRPVKKLMYFRFFDEWNWVIATSMNISDIDVIVARKEAAMEESLKRQMIHSILISLAILVLVSLVGLYMARRIADPVRKTTEMFRRIAEGSGDLTKRLRVNGSDETGRLSANFNIFLEKQQQMIRGILAKAETINVSSSNLLKSSASVSREVGDTNKKSVELAANTERVKTAVRISAASMTQAVANIQRINEVTMEMNATISHVASETGKAMQITKAAVRNSEVISNTVANLGKAAEEINKITELITDISSQTNLLALNAKIEASKAGQFGKGFGVVANEIKELAGRSNEAAAVISKRVHDIQQVSDDAVERIHEIITSIESVDPIISYISRSSDEQADISSEIVASISQISAGMQDLNQSVVRSSQALEKIDLEVEGIAVSSGKIDSESRAVEINANELFNLSEQLRSGLERFTI